MKMLSAMTLANSANAATAERDLRRANLILLAVPPRVGLPVHRRDERADREWAGVLEIQNAECRKPSLSRSAFLILNSAFPLQQYRSDDGTGERDRAEDRDELADRDEEAESDREENTHRELCAAHVAPSGAAVAR